VESNLVAQWEVYLPKPSSDHEFGGLSTDLKLSVVESYLRGFTTALRGKFAELWYIDAFAGTGERTVKHAAQRRTLIDAATDEKIERHRGSARIAIDVVPQFDRLIFMDNDPRHCRALQQLRFSYADRKIDVIEGDANEAIVEMVQGRAWAGTRAVMFLDPYGMSVAWETLEEINATEAIDVWYLVSLTGLFRQAALRASAIDESKRAALIRMLGTEDWEKAWYGRRTTLFGDADERFRTADVETIEGFVLKRLKQLFPCVLPPLRLKNDRGVPAHALFFAISNPAPRAIGLATKIANHILKAGRSSQVRPR